MTVLLDTQILLAVSIEGIESIPNRARKVMADAGTRRYVSAVSLTEIAIKAQIGKISASPEWIRMMITDLKLDLLPCLARHAMQLFDLPLHHREPFDRMLIATAIVEQIPLIGGDARFRLYKPEGLSVIWK